MNKDGVVVVCNQSNQQEGRVLLGTFDDVLKKHIPRVDSNATDKAISDALALVKDAIRNLEGELQELEPSGDTHDADAL